MTEQQDRFLGSLVGLATGDALGTTNEFVPQHAVTPVIDIVGGGKFRLLPGMWTDDTSMALCLAESLIEKGGRFDGIDQQERYYKWYMDGHLSSNGKCFDIGKTTRKHLLENLDAKREFHPNVSDGASGNGALMRLAPIPMLYSLVSSTDVAIVKSGDNSMTTHPSEISRDCCRYYAGLIIGAIHGATKEELTSSLYIPPHLPKSYWSTHPLRDEVLAVVRDQSFKTKSPPDIRNGAFSVDSLEAALWGFHRSNSFEEGALALSSLGDDSDTVAAIYGQLAGAFYGYKGIPSSWRQKITLLPLIVTFANELFHMATQLAEIDKNGKLSEDISMKTSNYYADMKKLYALLESEYALIMRKVDPSPRQYKSIDDFNNDIKRFETMYNELACIVKNVSDDDKNTLWKDFHTRLMKQDKETLELILKRKTGMGSMLGAIIRKQ
jgi:ADP-ribosyl-[dinitrogen reductase] hydrolase